MSARSSGCGGLEYIGIFEEHHCEHVCRVSNRSLVASRVYSSGALPSVGTIYKAN